MFFAYDECTKKNRTICPVILALLSLGDAYFLRIIRNAASSANSIGMLIIVVGAKKNLSVYCICSSICQGSADPLHIRPGPVLQIVLLHFSPEIRQRGYIWDCHTKIEPTRQNLRPGLHILEKVML
jgi:hypothetical protein